jgi:hypothetical protein
MFIGFHHYGHDRAGIHEQPAVSIATGSLKILWVRTEIPNFPFRCPNQSSSLRTVVSVKSGLFGCQSQFHSVADKFGFRRPRPASGGSKPAPHLGRKSHRNAIVFHMPVCHFKSV